MCLAKFQLKVFLVTVSFNQPTIKCFLENITDN